MRRGLAVAGLLLAVGCTKGPAPVVSDDAAAIATAERKAVGDTDAARRDAADPRAAEQSGGGTD